MAMNTPAKLWVRVSLLVSVALLVTARRTLEAVPGLAKALTVIAVLAVLGGQGQRVAAGTRLPRPVVVAVRDSSGNAVAGARLTLKPSAGTVEDSVAVTDTEGKSPTASPSPKPVSRPCAASV